MPIHLPSSLKDRLESFPRDFLWGVATSAYQIEGGRNVGGKGESIWDRFAHTPGRIIDGSTGDVAVDHLARWREDLDLMADLGIGAYRFSVAWSRVLPEGTGDVSAAGLGFYDRLVDELLARGIEPCPTLYHWDLPQALQEKGGWPVRDTVDAFVRYADVVSAAVGDRVTRWITHNEPWVASVAGHLEGAHAPGGSDWGDTLAAGHHLLLSHGKAVPIIRGNAPQAQVGIALDCRPSRPATDAADDLAAHRHFDGYRNRWFFDPVFGKGYPEDMVKSYRDRGRLDGSSFDRPGDTEIMGAEVDFLGLNYYTSVTVRATDDEPNDASAPPGPEPPDNHTEMGWSITPHALVEFLQRIRREYSPREILITENGASYSDGPDESGEIHDLRRIDYLENHVAALHEALALDVPVTGYFVWSLLDNLEWSHGFTQRFGLVWVDFTTLARTPKRSFAWYRQVIEAAGRR